MDLELVSLELTNQCAKACWFCYNHSGPRRETQWQPGEIIAFARDCAANGIKAFSFGGGEPLEYAGLWEVLEGLRGRLFLSLTSNGLLLDEATAQRLSAAGIDKVHISLHFPQREPEVEHVLACIARLERAGVHCGVNLLVTASEEEAAREAARRLHTAGVGNERIVYLPLRQHGEPTPKQIARVAGGPFQSMSCLQGCARSPRFVSIDWKKEAAWCSYTRARCALPELTFAGLCQAMDGLGLIYCGATQEPEAAAAFERS